MEKNSIATFHSGSGHIWIIVSKDCHRIVFSIRQNVIDIFFFNLLVCESIIAHIWNFIWCKKKLWWVDPNGPFFNLNFFSIVINFSFNLEAHFFLLKIYRKISYFIWLISIFCCLFAYNSLKTHLFGKIFNFKGNIVESWLWLKWQTYNLW